MSKGRLYVSAAAAAIGCLALGGCATTSDPSSLIPTQIQASVIAEDRMVVGPGGGSGISVDQMLARARQSGSDGAPAPGQAAGQAAGEGHPAGTGAPAGGAAVPAQAAAPASGPSPAPPASSAPAADAGPKPFFEVTYDGGEDQPPARAAEALAKKLKGARLPAKAEVTILAGPGPGATAFDQALLANRRARNIRSLLPEGWTISQVYDPAFPPDTVRIVVGPSS